jgi:hypothetical protein
VNQKPVCQFSFLWGFREASNPPFSVSNGDKELQNYYYRRIWVFKFISFPYWHVVWYNNNMEDFLERLNLGI